MGPAVEIVGNARGLLQLRRQIDRALKDDDRFRLEDALYRDIYEDEYEVVVRRAKSRGEMGPPVPRAEKAASERVPWAERARLQEAERRRGER